MAVVSTFCKKGGVGKSTFICFLAHYYATLGKQVLIISADDQNSIFKIFGAEEKVFESNDNYLEFLITGTAELGDVLIPVRENLYLIKTLNTESLALNLTLNRSQERTIKKIVKDYEEYFDYIFVDFPPSSNRFAEVLLDLSDSILIVVGLDTLGLDGFFNTIQYFVDKDLDLDSIKYVVPNGYSKTRRAPKDALQKLIKQSQDYTPNAIVLPSLQEKSIIKNLQAMGISVFDNVTLERYDANAKEALRKDLIALFETINI